MRASRRAAALLAIVLLLLPSSVGAQGFTQIGFATFVADVTLTTTAETSVISVQGVQVAHDTVNVCVLAYAQLTTGTNTTGVTARIRRGTTTSGTLVNEANVEQVKAAAGSTEPFFAAVCEQRTGIATLDYNLTLTQAAASANGTALQGWILVLVN